MTAPSQPPVSVVPAPAPITTMLLPAERLRVDVVGQGVYRALHRESLEDVLRDVRERRASAILVSVARCGLAELSVLSRLVREFPRVPAVALLSGFEHETARTVLELGHSGVRMLVDVRSADGWRELRHVLLSRDDADIERLALGQLSLDLTGAPDDCWRFFESLFRTGVKAASVRALAPRLEVLTSTLLSRFFRAGLPSPRRYLTTARLVRAARAFENPGMSVANVANQLEYSSPQSFSRHMRGMLHMSTREFRQRYDGEGMLRRFREELVLPYVPVLRRFSPLAPAERGQTADDVHSSSASRRRRTG